MSIPTPVPILVVQPDNLSVIGCRKAFMPAGLVENVDFICVMGVHTQTIVERLKRYKPKLLVTGFIADSQQEAWEVARAGKEMNPDLKVWFLSFTSIHTEEKDPIYDRCFEKKSGDEDKIYRTLAQAILQHLGR